MAPLSVDSKHDTDGNGEKMTGFCDVLSQELHCDSGRSRAPTVHKDMCRLARLSIPCVRQGNVKQLQSQASRADARRQRSGSLRGPAVRYLSPDPSTGNRVLGKGPLVGRARAHLVLGSVNPVAHLDVRNLGSHRDNCSAVIGAQEGPGRGEVASHLGVTGVERDGLDADVDLVYGQLWAWRVIPDCHLIVLIDCQSPLLQRRGEGGCGLGG